MGMHEVMVSRGFADDERKRVADLYWEAFGQKLRPGFANEQTGIQATRTGLQPEHVLVARRNGVLLGVLFVMYGFDQYTAMEIKVA